ncbi:DUF6268 family outer membrane beta-barrel protein [Roseivirga echinicomitans]|nr:DUF6268 family outer membrane beta-barrel protein [Roseivirga echinicomitans]
MSQDLQLAGFGYTTFPEAEIMDSRLSQKIQLNEYNFFLNMPKRLKNKKTVLINGFQYGLVTLNGDNDLHLGLDSQNLHLIGYRLTAIHQLANDWSLLASLNPTLASTFNTALEGEDFLFNGILQFTKKKSEYFSYGGGIAYLSTFGEPAFIPTLQLTLKSNNSKFQVFLPRQITYSRFYGRITAGVQLSASGSRYNVNNSSADFNDFEYVDQLAYSRVILGPTFSYLVGKLIQLEASGGITFGRKAELQGDLYEGANYDVANGAFFRFGISIVPPKK